MLWILKLCTFGVALVLAAGQTEPAADPRPTNVPSEPSRSMPAENSVDTPVSKIAAIELSQGVKKPKAPLSQGTDSWTPMGKTGGGGTPPWEPLTGQLNQDLPYDQTASQMTIGEQVMQRRQEEQQQQPQQYDIFGFPIDNNPGGRVHLDFVPFPLTLTKDANGPLLQSRHRRQVDRFDWSSEKGHRHESHVHPPKPPTTKVPQRRPPPPPPMEEPMFQKQFKTEHSKTAPENRFSNMQPNQQTSNQFSSVNTQNGHTDQQTENFDQTVQKQNQKPLKRHFSSPPNESPSVQDTSRTRPDVLSLFPGDQKRHFSAPPSEFSPEHPNAHAQSVPHPSLPDMQQELHQFDTVDKQQTLAPSYPSNHFSSPNYDHKKQAQRFTDAPIVTSGQHGDSQQSQHNPDVSQNEKHNIYAPQTPVYVDNMTGSQKVDQLASPYKQEAIYSTQGQEIVQVQAEPASAGTETPLDLGNLLGDMNIGQGHGHSHSNAIHNHKQEHPAAHDHPVLPLKENSRANMELFPEVHQTAENQASVSSYTELPNKQAAGVQVQQTNQGPLTNANNPQGTKTAPEQAPMEEKFMVMFDAWYADKFGKSTQKPTTGGHVGSSGGLKDQMIDKQALFQEFLTMFKNQQNAVSEMLSTSNQKLPEPPSNTIPSPPAEQAPSKPSKQSQPAQQKAPEPTHSKGKVIDVAPKLSTPVTTQSTAETMETTEAPPPVEVVTRPRHAPVLKRKRIRSRPATGPKPTPPSTTAKPTIDPELLADINEARSMQGLPALLPHQVDLQGNILPFYKRQMFNGRLPSRIRPSLFNGGRTIFPGDPEMFAYHGHSRGDAHAHNLELQHRQIHMEAGRALTPELHRQIHQLLRQRHENGQRNSLFASMQTQAPVMDADLMADLIEAQSAGMVGRK